MSLPFTSDVLDSPETGASLRAGASDSERQRFFDQLDDGCCIIEKLDTPSGEPSDYRYIEANAVFGQESGVSDVQGKTIRACFPGIEEAWYEGYDAVVASGAPLRMTRHLSPFGRVLELYVCRLGDEGSRRLGIRFKDITDRAMEIERLRLLFRDTPGFMAILRGPDHVVEIANEAYLDLVGYRDLVGKPLVTSLPEAAAQGYVAILDEVYRTGTPYLGQGARLDVPDFPGGPPMEKYVNFVYQPMFEGSMEPVGIFVQGHVVTDEYLAQRALIVADRHKDQFIATLAHELRNPLAPIRMAARVLQIPQLPARVATETIGIIARQADHMARLLDDLLDIARVSKNLMLLQKSFVTVESLVMMALETAGALIEIKKHRLAVNHQDAFMEIEADPVRITQVISNILTNAAKYTDIGGEITVSTRLEGSDCVISVTDSGIGLPATALTSIFTMFAQEKSALERSEGGLGIGLALARGLVELHEGSIEASSPGLGHGSKFTVRLPNARRRAPLLPLSLGHAPAVVRQKTILVVDDNVDLVTTLASFLELLGHRVLTASSGPQALALAANDVPDVAILDIGMPEMNGYELAIQIRRTSWGEKIFLVAATGWGQEGDKDRAVLAGFDVHLTKPIAIETLEELLARP
jgi:signal transduction histidine kinase